MKARKKKKPITIADGGMSDKTMKGRQDVERKDEIKINPPISDEIDAMYSYEEDKDKDKDKP